MKVASLSDLPGKGGKRGGIRDMFGQNDPDPYCKVSVGSTKFRTSVVKNSKEPEWEDWYEFPLEVLQGTLAEVKVYDEDTFSRDEFMGHVLVDVGDNIGGVATADLLPMEGKHSHYDISGQASLELSWTPLVSTPGGERSFPGKTAAVLTVFIYSVNNLETGEEAGPSVSVVVTAAGERRETKEVKNSPQPEFLEEFVFLVESGWEEQELVMEVNNTGDGSVFGEVRFGLADLVEEDITRKILPLSEENSHQTIIISAWIRFPGCH